jgi:hypothetical protein
LSNLIKEVVNIYFNDNDFNASYQSFSTSPKKSLLPFLLFALPLPEARRDPKALFVTMTLTVAAAHLTQKSLNHGGPQTPVLPLKILFES